MSVSESCPLEECTTSCAAVNRVLWGNPAPKAYRCHIGALNRKGVAFIPVYTTTPSISFDVVNGGTVRIYGCYGWGSLTDLTGTASTPFHHLIR